ncbi:MAG: 50S ribosomal protein L24 [Nitrospiraceae bacterium]|nr:50S ribosomal protein L24 [Nitrospiraceae bacterium]MDA8325984.1 50S ribosomal protein L24 [Nitrospiraceae bacterium]
MGLGIKKGDTVAVLAGKEKGKKGRIISVLTDKAGKGGKVLVEKLNIIKRHTKPSKTHEQGGIIEKEGPIHASNVMLVCPKCGARTKIAAHMQADGGKLRVCKKCKEVID